MIDHVFDAFNSILPATERAKELVGECSGRYKFEELLSDGEGGFGVVYRISNPDIAGLSLAAKVFKVYIKDDEDGYKKFQQEVGILSRVSDTKNVVQIKHTGEIYGMPWYAMELLNGESLHRIIEQRREEDVPPASSWVTSVISGVLGGLDELGESMKRDDQRITHRDVTPRNVMVMDANTERPRIKLIDPGIASLFQDSDTEETTGAPVVTEITASTYTSGYESPEMIASPQKVNPQSDLFQVGLIGYELMTGRKYWNDWPNINFDQWKHSEGTALWQAPLIQTITSCLFWDRDRRFESPADALEALHGASAWKRFARHITGRSARWVLTLLVIVLGVTSFYGDDRQGSGEVADDSLYAQISIGRKLVSDGISDLPEIRKLKGLCDKFVTMHPEHTASKQVRLFGDWLGRILDLEILIVPRSIKDDRHFDPDVEVFLRIEHENKTVREWKKRIPELENVSDLSGASLRAKWKPGMVVRGLIKDHKDENETRSFTIRLDLKGDEGMATPRWRPLWKVDTMDGKIVFIFDIIKVGIGEMPKIPSP